MCQFIELTEERRNNEEVCFSQNVLAMNTCGLQVGESLQAEMKSPDADVFPAPGAQPASHVLLVFGIVVVWLFQHP